MNTLTPIRNPWAQGLFGTITVLLLALGASVLYGWFAQIEWLVRVRPGMPVMPANTALAFGLFAVVFAGVAQGSVRWCVLALLPAALGAATFVQFAQGASLGLDEWLVRHAFDPQPYPGRTAPVVAACFALEGAVLATLLFGQRFAWRAPALAVTGSVVTATGLAAVVGYLSRLPMAYTWGTDSPVALHTAIGLILLGVGTVVLATHDREPDAGPGARWLPYPVAIGFATMTLIFWTALNQREVDFQQSTLALTGNNIAFALNTEFEDQLKAAARIATREALAPTASPRLRQIDAEVQARDFPAFRYYAWLGSDLRAQTVHPSTGFEHAVGYSHGVEPARQAAIERARLQRSPTMTEPLQFELGGVGFAVYAPIYRGEQFVGLVAGEYRYREFVETLDRRLNLSSAYTFALAIQGETVFSTLPPPESRPARFRTFEETYTVQGQRVRVTVAALPGGGRELPLTFNNVVLLFGFGIALLVGLVVNLTQKANLRRLAAEDTSRRLQQENYERRQVEAKLKLSEDRLNLALDSSQVGVFDWNVPTGKCHFSPGIWTLLGYQPGAMAPSLRSWDHLVHPDDRAQLRREFAPQSGHVFYESEYRVRTRGGDWLWVLERAKCVSFSPEGRPLRVTGTFQDISSRKQAEEALKASQAETRKLAIVASITDNLVVIADAAGRIEWVNESFTRLLEFSLGEVSGEPVERFLFSRDLDPDGHSRVQTAFHNRLPFTAEIVTAAKGGRRFHLHLELQPVCNEAGTVEKFIAVLYDITARIETERNLRTAKAQAEATTRAKSEFLASMSHEIRTPMNGVIALTSLLLESPLNHEQRDWVRTIRSSGDALLTIINDILDFSKIESGRMEIEQHPFDLANCIEEALELFALPAGGKHIELAYVLADDVPHHVVGDPTRLRQVLINLVGNAVKFTPAGSISIEVYTGPGPGQVAFAVTDTGIGIPADRQEMLFQPFSQVDSSTTRRFGGTGLGLAICKRLVELMGGEIALASQPSVGTTFRFHIDLPAAPTDAGEAAPSSAAAAPIGGGRVACVVDDNPVVRAFLARNLAAAGFTVYTAASPDDAAKLPADLAPALLLVDDTSPGDAALSLDTLRGHFGTESSTAFLLCLAGQTPPPERLAAMGVRGCLLKPLRRRALREHLDQVDALAPAAGLEHSPAPSEVFADLAARIPLRILVAEDNPVNKKVALRLLQRLGYRAEAVANGLEAVHALAATDYQLVFMDVQMPELDGIEATKRIRSEIPPARQPIIVALTANALHGDAEECRAAGMDDYITKPVRPEDIHQAILRHFDKSAPVAAES